MNFYYIFLLLLVVLSAYSESPQYGKPADSLDLTRVTVCPNSSSDSLGVLAPVLPQSEVFRSQNVILPQNEVFQIVPPQNGVNISVLHQNGVCKIDCQLSNKFKAIIDFVLNLGVKSFKILTSTLINGGEKLGWTIRILLESLQHVLKMYTWSLSENQTSVRFKCRLIGLLLKQSLFRKHDFAAFIYRVYHDCQYLDFWDLKFFSNCKNNSHTHIKEYSEKLTTFHFHDGGKSLMVSSDELHSYSSADLYEQQYQFLQCIKKDNIQTLDPNDGNVLCSVPLNVLVPKLTLKSVK